jgi:hypothetical protein
MIQMTTTTRFDHSNCDHPKSGAEGKKARAICRKEHAKKALEAATKKPATRKPRATRKPAAKVPVSTVEPKVIDMTDVDDI